LGGKYCSGLLGIYRLEKKFLKKNYGKIFRKILPERENFSDFFSDDDRTRTRAGFFPLLREYFSEKFYKSMKNFLFFLRFQLKHSPGKTGRLEVPGHLKKTLRAVGSDLRRLCSQKR
jgi:hypothetical protein